MESMKNLRGTYDRKLENIERNVSSVVIKRLPRYHRYLGELLREGKLRISSSALSRLMGVTASQIRQDLNCFGGFGQQGYGYNVQYLYNKVSELLGVMEGYTAVIVGAGNLGRALAATHMFERRGVRRVAMFDIDPKIIGTEIYGLPVYDISILGDFCKSERVDIGVLTVPKAEAQNTAEALVAAGVRGIWNFASTELHIEPPTIVENIHLGDSLMQLCYSLKSDTDNA